MCPDEQHLKALDSAWSSSNLPRCCPQSHLTLHKGQNLLCPLSENDKGGLISEGFLSLVALSTKGTEQKTLISRA